MQARMGSSRYPGKVLADLGGRPLVQRVLDRAAAIPGIDDVVLAIPEGDDDDPLEEAGHRLHVHVVRGHATDVLSRYHAAARYMNADAIVRVTADCPLLDPEVSGRVVKRFLDGGADYVSNTHPPTFPDGYDTEVMTRAALDQAARDAHDPYEREHVTPFIWRRPDRFRLVNVADGEDRSWWRLSVDTAADLDRVRAIWSRLGDGAGLADVAGLLTREPHLLGKTS